MEEIQIENLKFHVQNDNKNSGINITVLPDLVEKIKNKKNELGDDSFSLLWNKLYFGINHRQQMFEVLFNTFEDLFLKEDKVINDHLTLQALYCDMIIRLGTMLEDFAGICHACKEYNVNSKDIAEVFLAYKDPKSFYYSAVSNSRMIKRVFKLPESKRDLNKTFNKLTNEETEVLWKGVQATTKYITSLIKDISTAVIPEEKHDFTYFDFYNKLKHGFAPIYPFAEPNILTFRTQKELSYHELIEKTMDTVYIMHDKLAGQRSSEEKDKFESSQLATPIITASEEVNLETVKRISGIVNLISEMYRRLVNSYMDDTLQLSVPQDAITPEEYNIIRNIVEDYKRYIWSSL